MSHDPEACKICGAQATFFLTDVSADNQSAREEPFCERHAPNVDFERRAPHYQAFSWVLQEVFQNNCNKLPMARIENCEECKEFIEQPGGDPQRLGQILYDLAEFYANHRHIPSEHEMPTLYEFLGPLEADPWRDRGRGLDDA